MKNHQALPQVPQTEPDLHRAHPVRNLVGAVGVALALAGSGPATETASASHARPPEAPAQGDLHRKPSSLPGYKVPVNPETRRQGEQATVEIRWRYKYGDSSQPWYKDCSAVKANVDGNIRLSTAAHCFERLTGEHWGLLEAKPGQPKSLDYISQADGFVEYAVFDPLVPPRERKPLAKVDGISIGTGQDWALLSVAPLESPPVDVPRTFDQIPALKLATKQSEAPPRPARGQKVFFHGIPSANGERRISGLGRYLGRLRLNNEDGGYRYVDVSGIKPKTISEDTCMPGTSGSSFTATSKGNVTYTSGALAGVINETWAPALFDDLPSDKQPRDVTNEIEEAKVSRAWYQDKLGVDLSSFSTICINSANLPNSVNTLNAGIGNLVPKPAPTGDGSPVGFESGKGGSDTQSMK